MSDKKIVTPKRPTPEPKRQSFPPKLVIPDDVLSVKFSGYPEGVKR